MLNTRYLFYILIDTTHKAFEKIASDLILISGFPNVSKVVSTIYHWPVTTYIMAHKELVNENSNLNVHRCLKV